MRSSSPRTPSRSVIDLTPNPFPLGKGNQRFADSRDVLASSCGALVGAAVVHGTDDSARCEITQTNPPRDIVERWPEALRGTSNAEPSKTKCRNKPTKCWKTKDHAV